MKFLTLTVFLLASPLLYPSLQAADSGNSSQAKFTLGLNWKAEPEFAGFYQAKLDKLYESKKIDLTIQEGGAGTPTIQMVSAGKIDFAIVSGDEFVIAKSNGQDLVPLYAVYQKSPYMLMVRSSKNIKTLEQLFQSDLTVSMIKGLPFVAWLEKKYGFSKVTVVPYAGGITNYLNNENFAQQGFISSEPLLAEKKGIKTTVLPVYESGFNPYVVLMVSTRKIMKEKPQEVKAMVQATQMGWQNYLRNPKSVFTEINKMNPTMTLDVMNSMFDKEKTLIESDDTKKHGLGYINPNRLKELSEQLFDLKLIKAKSNF